MPLIPLAHVGAVPLEESLLPLASGVSAGLLLARGWMVRWRKRRKGGMEDVVGDWPHR